MRVDFVVQPVSGRPPAGSVAVPGDKSISHRALILAALAEGETRIHGLLASEDCLNTLQAMQALGIDIRPDGEDWLVQGRGLCGLQAPVGPIDCGNSGTGMRLLAGLLAAQPFDSELVGDASLMQRPMRRIADPLNAVGAAITTDSDGTPPLRIQGSQALRDIDYAMPMASAQVKSALLLAALAAGRHARITEPAVSRNHTETLLQGFGVPLERQGSVIALEPVPKLDSPGRLEVPGDLSSAAFFLVLGLLQEGAAIQLEGVGINATRDGLLRVLTRMGARFELERRDRGSGEGWADIDVEPSALRAVDIDADDVALAIDEIPVLLVAAACAEGTTRLRGAAELRVKESDRLAAMAAGLRALGIEVTEYADGLDVTGGKLQGGEVDSFGDHRIAMAFAIAATVAQGPVTIRNVANVATSYPRFRGDLSSLGIDIKEIEVSE
ncbi:MAG: 3-phosphoshikimate 1-carboxyvinyltransferase [Gammaproteobacteria bacterium]|nr:3-phosphoshikimate 1-carboxyvinyltransferase [Gammaproteobacteria bacterium]